MYIREEENIGKPSGGEELGHMQMVDTWENVIRKSLVNFLTRKFNSYLHPLSACSASLCDVPKQPPWQRHCGPGAKEIERKRRRWHIFGGLGSKSLPVGRAVRRRRKYRLVNAVIPSKCNATG